MSPSCLKTLWHVVEIASESDLLSLDDRNLTDWLQKTVAERQVLDLQEREKLRVYIRSHLLLIRDLADSRQLSLEQINV
ncbi:MAG: hypothetical protein AAF329_03090 [Cyanobacteria bacterium P01_A01_bin.17]